jgi:hypothetical protein
MQTIEVQGLKFRKPRLQPSVFEPSRFAQLSASGVWLWPSVER